MEYLPDDPRSTNKLMLSEQELLAAVARGDMEAFREVYHLFAGDVQRYIFLFTRSREDTEEILQDVFIKLWEKKERLTVITSFRGYLFRMARNHVLNHFRGAKIRIQTEELSERAEKHSGGATAADPLLYKQYYKLARQAIDLLPERRKRVFLLNLEEDLSQQQIADQLGVSKSAVKQHLYLAARFIREYLQKHGVPG